MKNRFSPRELFELRNNIPVDMLIRDYLQIPSKIRDGFFRFLCPMCNEFQTAVNPSTNLARCFRCEKNFNAIDWSIYKGTLGYRKVPCIPPDQILWSHLQFVPNWGQIASQWIPGPSPCSIRFYRTAPYLEGDHKKRHGTDRTEHQKIYWDPENA